LRPERTGRIHLLYGAIGCGVLAGTGSKSRALRNLWSRSKTGDGEVCRMVKGAVSDEIVHGSFWEMEFCSCRIGNLSDLSAPDKLLILGGWGLCSTYFDSRAICPQCVYETGRRLTTIEAHFRSAPLSAGCSWRY
jgi:hypothetical protein